MIKERYKIGDTFSMDFDYEGMLDYGLQITNNTGVNDLEKLLTSFEDVNYHREANPLYDLIEHIKYQNEYGSNEVTRENIDKSLWIFKRECEETLINIVNTTTRINIIENNAPNHLDDFHKMITKENEKTSIIVTKEEVRNIPNDAKLGEYIRNTIKSLEK